MQPRNRLEEIQISIAELKTEVKGTNNHLATMNGSISKLYARDEVNLQALNDHAKNCPGLEVIQEIKTKLETGNHPGAKAVNDALLQFNIINAKRAAEENTNKDWVKRFQPFISFAIFALLIWMLLDMHNFIEAVKVVKP